MAKRAPAVRVCVLALAVLFACGCSSNDEREARKEPAPPPADATAKLADELARTRAELTRLAAQLEAATAEIHQLAQKIEASNSESKKAIQDLGEPIADRKRRAPIRLKLKKLRPDIRPRLVPKPVPQPRAAIRGKVTAVDKRLGLVIFNKGQRDGVQKGDIFTVARKGMFVRTVVVDDVFGDLSAARYVKDGPAHIEVGDEVIRQRPADF